MPRTPTDYSKTIIYRLSHKEIEGLDYVGSTTDFSCRKAEHKYGCINPKSKSHHLKVYQTIRENGGWEMFQMIEIKKYPCQDKREAEAEEERSRKVLKAKLNTQRAYLSDDDRKMYQKEHNQLKYERSKDQCKEESRQYYAQHKERIQVEQKKYREQHKIQIAERMKQYVIDNKEKLSEKSKEKYEQNKEKINETLREKYTCELCDCSLSIGAKSRHERSKKHQANLVL